MCHKINTKRNDNYKIKAGLSSPGVPWHPQILADHLTISQTGGADYLISGTTTQLHNGWAGWALAQLEFGVQLILFLRPWKVIQLTVHSYTSFFYHPGRSWSKKSNIKYQVCSIYYRSQNVLCRSKFLSQPKTFTAFNASSKFFVPAQNVCDCQNM